MNGDTARKLLAAVCLIGLLGALVVLSFSDRTAKPMNINGDMLGQDVSESLPEYRDRAADSLAAAPAGEAGFGLITFTDPLPPAEAGTVLAELGRVNAMIMLSASPVPLPEPVAGETREDVFNRALERIDHSLAGIGDITAPREINSVIVWDDGATLREVAEQEQVFSVEVLPTDAAWGRFGVRPVDLDS